MSWAGLCDPCHRDGHLVDAPVCPDIHLPKDTCVASRLGQLRVRLLKPSQAGVCMSTSSRFSRVDAQEWDSWAHGR